MKRCELAYELAERADVATEVARKVLDELGNLFLEWLRQDDDEFPVGYMGLFRKENGRVRWRMSRKARYHYTRRVGHANN